jgi:ferredoxin-NADP reductase
MIAKALFLLSGVALIFAAGLLVDGLRAIWRRQRQSRRRIALETPLELEVVAREEVAGHLLCLRLAAPEGGRLPPFVAGQHVLLQAPAGKDGQFIRRAYSLAAWTARPQQYELGIKREANGRLSRWAWDRLHVGSRVDVLPPRGEFTVGLGHHEVVLIGGGIGITPMRAMLHALLAQARPVVLHHAARREEELLYRDEFERLCATTPRFRYVPTLTRPGPEWRGATGRLDAARILAACADARHAEFYLCAANAMMDALRAGLIAGGIADGRIHHEAFGAAAGSAPIGLAIRVGDRVCVTAGEPTLLATLEENRLAPESECRAGTCGLCRMRLIEGRIDWLLEPELALDADEILPCICTPATALQLSHDAARRL